ncbi:MAG TPA: class I SAM-dependent methyltransferase [Acidimicrobiales bacterium]|nr:class I SAM-dependent methyltransferase [Acidimicrobiales bacterium]
MLSHYHAPIDPDEQNNSHATMLRMVGFNKRVLETGCASGHMSAMLKAQGCSIVGMELDASVVEPAQQWLERVVIGDLEDPAVWAQLDGDVFDAILFGDVLEHLRDPLPALREAATHLAPSGVVVISVPNIAHADVKAALIKGLFPYSESGLLDRTHISFFTKESLVELVREAGLAVVEISRITVPAFATEIGIQRDDVDDATFAAITADREALTYQFVVRAVRDDAEHAVDKLSLDLVDLSDQLLDQTSLNTALCAQNERLTREVEALQAQRAIDQRDLANLRGQREAIKRFLPGPLRRFIQQQFGLGSS